MTTTATHVGPAPSIVGDKRLYRLHSTIAHEGKLYAHVVVSSSPLIAETMVFAATVHGDIDSWTELGVSQRSHDWAAALADAGIELEES